MRLRLSVLLLAAALYVSTFASAADWPTFMGSAERTGRIQQAAFDPADQAPVDVMPGCAARKVPIVHFCGLT